MTIDEILALYLIDVAERCKKSSPVPEASQMAEQEAVEKPAPTDKAGKASNTKGGAKGAAAAKES